MKNNKKGEQIGIADIISFLKQSKWSIFGWTLSVVAIVLVIVTFFMTPKYNSNIDVLVNQKTNNTQAQLNAQQADLQAIGTYKDVLTKPVILSPVLREVRTKDNYKGNVNSLKNSISIDNETSSRVININVVDSNPYVAADIANMVGKVFTKKIKKMMQIDNVTVVSKAVPNTKPVSPNIKIIGIISMLVGLLIGSSIAIFKGIMDTTVKSTEFLSDELGLVNLGNVYHVSENGKKYHVASVKKNEFRSSLQSGRRHRV